MLRMKKQAAGKATMHRVAPSTASALSWSDVVVTFSTNRLRSAPLALSGRQEPVDITAAIANVAIRAVVHPLEIEECEEGRVELSTAMPEALRLAHRALHGLSVKIDLYGF